MVCVCVFLKNRYKVRNFKLPVEFLHSLQQNFLILMAQNKACLSVRWGLFWKQDTTVIHKMTLSPSQMLRLPSHSPLFHFLLFHSQTHGFLSIFFSVTHIALKVTVPMSVWPFYSHEPIHSLRKPPTRYWMTSSCAHCWWNRLSWKADI